MRKSIATDVAVLACGVLAAPAAANHSWNGYHWARTAGPFTVALGDNVTTAWDTYLARASANWSSSQVLDTTIAAGGGRKTCRATTGRVEVCNSTYGQNGWLGLASIWTSGGTHITQGTVKLNDTYFKMARYNNAAERDHVTCQEVGHTFGLGHQSEDGTDLDTCMDYAAEPAANNLAPNAHDYAQLESIYSHVDTLSTLAASTATQAQSDRARPYRTVRNDSSRESTITEYFPDDSRRIEHIVWARD
jgi:hypothetical protein